jgi:2-dehydropantoate 2-reductase
MRVAIVGAGGLGSKYAAYLAAKAEVTVLHRRADYVEQVQRHGLRMVTPDGTRTAAVTATLDPADLAGADVVLFAVKSYDTATVIVNVAPYLGPTTVVLSVQNGLGNFESIVDHVGPERAGLAVTTEGATLSGPGEVLDKGKGITYVGAPGTLSDGPRMRLLGDFVDLLNDCGLAAELNDQIEGLLWAKLAMVTGINPLAVLLRVSNGDIGRIPQISTLSRTAISEVVEVATRRGITLAFDPLEAFERTTSKTAGMLSGSLLDSLRHKRTEIGAICGAVARAAEEVGVAAPVNDTIAKLVEALEASYACRVEAPPK